MNRANFSIAQVIFILLFENVAGVRRGAQGERHYKYYKLISHSTILFYWTGNK